MSSGFYLKNRLAKLDYSIDWTQEIGTDSVSPGGSGWLVDPPWDSFSSPNGLKLVPSSPTHAAGISSAAFSGGENGKTYSLTNTVECLSGRVLARTLTIRIGEESAL
jgi:hypothetical protein